MKRTLLMTATLLAACTASEPDLDSRTQAGPQVEPTPVLETGDKTTEGVAACRAALHLAGTDKGGEPIELANLDVETILAECPALERHLRFRGPAGEPLAFRDWSDAQRRTFIRQYQFQVLSGDPIPISCPEPRARMVAGDVPSMWVSAVYLTATEAFDIYAAQAAHVLYVEATRAVPWSILDRPEVELDVLLDASAYIAPIRPSLSPLPAGIVAGRDYQLPFSVAVSLGYTCDPHDGYRFVRGLTSSSGRDLVGATPEATLANLTLWLAQSVRHGPVASQTVDADLALATFAFQLRDRLRPRYDFSYGGRAAAPVGCHSAAHVLEELARSVNIPLLNVAMADGDSGSTFGVRTHRGLVYRFGTAAPRIVETLDDIFAVELYPGVGFGPAPAETLFATVWRSKDELRAAGMTIFDDYPVVLPGVGFGVGDGGPYERRLDYGRLLGNWPDFIPDHGSRNLKNFLYRQQESVCSRTFVREYCEGLSSDPAGAWRHFQFTTSGQIPYLATEAEAQHAWAATEACVTAAGGCLPAMRTLDFLASQIDAVWVDL